MIELTVPYYSPDCLYNARAKKGGKELYQLAIISDLMDSREFHVEFTTIEIAWCSWPLVTEISPLTSTTLETHSNPSGACTKELT